MSSSFGDLRARIPDWSADDEDVVSLLELKIVIAENEKLY